MEQNKITIAIDGPVGSGKGTLGIALGKKLGALYLYTGGMYRALTLECIRRNVDLRDEEAVLQVLFSCNLHLEISESGTKVFLGEENVNEKIFLPEVSNNTPIVAAHPQVREEMVKRQKDMVKDRMAVIEGRDITTVVAPNAELKIYLTADVEKRARRRFEQFQERGIEKTFEEVLEDTKKRDEVDSEREVSPMTITSDAVVIDTSDDTIDDTVDKVIVIMKERGLL